MDAGLSAAPLRGGGRGARLRAVEDHRRGAGGRADAHAAHAAGDPDGLDRLRRHAARARRRGRGRRRPLARRVLGAGLRRRARVRRRGAPGAPARQVHAGGGARGRRRDGGDHRARRVDGGRHLPRGARRDDERRLPAGELQRRRAGGDRRAQGRGRARDGAGQAEGRQAGQGAAGVRAVPLGADGAGGRAAARRARARRRSRRSRVPVVANVDRRAEPAMPRASRSCCSSR